MGLLLVLYKRSVHSLDLFWTQWSLLCAGCEVWICGCSDREVRKGRRACLDWEMPALSVSFSSVSVWILSFINKHAFVSANETYHNLNWDLILHLGERANLQGELDKAITSTIQSSLIHPQTCIDKLHSSACIQCLLPHTYLTTLCFSMKFPLCFYWTVFLQGAEPAG